MHIRSLLKKSFFIIVLFSLLSCSVGNTSDNPIPPQESLGPNPNLPKNEAGETYGAALNVSPYEKEPDLIEAIGMDGNTGYVRLTELNGEMPRSPEEALALQAKQKTRYINL